MSAEDWRRFAEVGGLEQFKPRSVPQPEFTPPVFEAFYQATHVASCPDCFGDLEDVGPKDFWCPRDRKYYSPAEVGWMEDDYDYDD